MIHVFHIFPLDPLQVTCGCFHDRLDQKRMEGEPVTGYGQNLRPPMRHLDQKQRGELRFKTLFF